MQNKHVVPQFIIDFAIAFILIPIAIAHAETVTHTYDDLNRLIRSDYSDGTVIIFEYDKIGNRTVKRRFYKPHVLTVHKGGEGAGTVTSTPVRLTCGSTCAEMFSEGTYITLTAAPNAGSGFIEWSGAGCGSSPTCSFSIAADTEVSAIFQPSGCTNLPVKNVSTGIYYSSLQAACNSAGAGATIRSQAVTLVENLAAGNAVSITLDGGYNCDFSTKIGVTNISGSITTNNGITTIMDFVL